MLIQAFLFFYMIIVRPCYVFLSYKNRGNDRAIYHILNLDCGERPCGQRENEYTTIFALLSCVKTRMDGETFSFSHEIFCLKIHKTDIMPDKGMAVCTGLLLTL